MKDYIIAGALFALVLGCVIGCIWVLRQPPCDIATKPLVIECVAHGGGNCIEQVQKLNGCVFQ